MPSKGKGRRRRAANAAEAATGLLKKGSKVLYRLQPPSIKAASAGTVKELIIARKHSHCLNYTDHLRGLTGHVPVLILGPVAGVQYPGLAHARSSR